MWLLKAPVSNQIVLTDTQGPELRSWWSCSTLCWSNHTQETASNSRSHDLRKTLTIVFTGRRPRWGGGWGKVFFKELGLFNIEREDSGERPSYFQSLNHLGLSRAGTKWKATEERGCLNGQQAPSLWRGRSRNGMEGGSEEKGRDRMEFNYNSSKEQPQFCLEHLPPVLAQWLYSFLFSDCIQNHFNNLLFTKHFIFMSF